MGVADGDGELGGEVGEQVVFIGFVVFVFVLFNGASV